MVASALSVTLVLTVGALLFDVPVAGSLVDLYLGALLFIVGLRGMGSPVSARQGIVWAGYGMLIAIAGTFLVPGLIGSALCIAATTGAWQ